MAELNQEIITKKHLTSSHQLQILNSPPSFPEDVALLASVLLRCFQNSPSICEELIGTGIIEEDYFMDKL